MACEKGWISQSCSLCSNNLGTSNDINRPACGWSLEFGDFLPHRQSSKMGGGACFGAKNADVNSVYSHQKPLNHGTYIADAKTVVRLTKSDYRFRLLLVDGLFNMAGDSENMRSGIPGISERIQLRF